MLSLRNVASKFYFQVSRRRDAAFPVFPAPASMCVTLDILSSTQNTGRLSPWPIPFPSLFALRLTFYLMLPFNPRNLCTSDLVSPTDFQFPTLLENYRRAQDIYVYCVSSLKFFLFVLCKIFLHSRVFSAT